MTRQLVFVHGRAQEGKDSIALKQEWIAAWKKGLAKSDLQMPIDESQIRFPYYGDTLVQMAGGLSTEEAAQIQVRGQQGNEAAIPAEQAAFVFAYLEEVQKETGITDAQVTAQLVEAVRERGVLNWGWVQGLLSMIDKVPGASSLSVAMFTNDVYKYLKMPGIRSAMDAGVRSAFTPGIESVVVSHSLGTVVAYNVLNRDASEPEPALKVPLFITLGSPLALRTVKKEVRPIRRPACAAKWFNAMDERDVVALFPLTMAHFETEPAIENKTDVDNDTANRHGISGYLGDAEVARRIYDALLAK